MQRRPGKLWPFNERLDRLGTRMMKMMMMVIAWRHDTNIGPQMHAAVPGTVMIWIVLNANILDSWLGYNLF